MSASDWTAGMLDEMVIWFNPRLREAMVLTGESDGRPGAPPAGSNEGTKFSHILFSRLGCIALFDGVVVCDVIEEMLCIEPAVLNTVTASQEPREYFIGILAVSMLPGSGGSSGC